MIAGVQIAEALSKFIGKGDYDPGLQPNKGKLPVTMRDLVEDNFDDTYQEDFMNREYSIELDAEHDIKAGRARRVYTKNVITAEQLQKIVRPAAPHKQVQEDCRGFYPLLSSYYEYLKRRGEADRIDIDHPLSLCGWPLFMRFAKEVKQRTGRPYEEFFTQDQDEMETGEPQIWNMCWLPLWVMDNLDTEVPLLEFLESINAYNNFGNPDDLRFPEAVHDMMNDELAHNLMGVFRGILKNRRFNLFPPEWAIVLKYIFSSNSITIACSDQSETAMDIGDHKDIAFFFEEAAKLVKMREITAPLVDACGDHCDQFWKDFIKVLKDIDEKTKAKNAR